MTRLYTSSSSSCVRNHLTLSKAFLGLVIITFHVWHKFSCIILWREDCPRSLFDPYLKNFTAKLDWPLVREKENAENVVAKPLHSFQTEYGQKWSLQNVSWAEIDTNRAAVEGTICSDSGWAGTGGWKEGVGRGGGRGEGGREGRGRGLNRSPLPQSDHGDSAISRQMTLF